MGIFEDLGMVAAIDRIEAEQPTEQENLCDEKQPHPELAGVELLLRRIEMMRQKRRMVLVVFVLVG